MTDQAFRDAADAAKKHHADIHVHGPACTFDICAVGPTRRELVRGTVLSKRQNGQRLEHYKGEDLPE